MAFKKNALNLNPGKNAHLPRNSFDLSYHSIFTSPAGMLLPAYVQDVQPGDFLSLDVKNFSRTMPVNTAAFSRLKEVTDFYFVPYRLLWRQFNQFITGVSDIDTSYIPDGTNVPTSVPSISISELINLMNPAGTVLNDIHGFRNIANIERLLDLLGYPVSNDKNCSTYQMYLNMRDSATNKSLPVPSFNPFRLLAYQKIFYDYYRNSDYTANIPSFYNIDKYASGSSVGGVNQITQIHYAQWKKDRLTSVKPSPLATFSSPNLSFAVPEGSTSSLGYSVPSSSRTNLLSSVSGSASNTSISELRATMAYDRLARLTMLSPKTYEAQLKSHFGVEPDNCDYCSCKFLGSFDSDLNIGEVTAAAAGETTSGSKSVLGQLAGKGISSGSRNGVIKSSFNEHGVVLGIHYFLPYSEYDSNRVDDFNRKLNRNDYYMPAYDNLGLQPIIGASVNINPFNVTEGQLLTNTAAWQARYLEYKTRVDEVHGQFQTKQPLSAWCLPRTAVLPSGGLIAESNLYVNPKVADSIFALAYDGTQVSDPFMCHFKFDATLVRNMSVLGIPSL